MTRASISVPPCLEMIFNFNLSKKGDMSAACGKASRSRIRMEVTMGSRLKLVAVALVLLAALGISPQRTQAQAQSSSPATPADYLKWRNELKNWGRWGADDDRGASNLITPAKSLSAAKLVKSGIVVSLAHAVPMLRFRRLPSSTVLPTASPLRTRPILIP